MANRYMLDEQGDPLTRDEWMARVTKTSEGTLRKLADLWVPPVSRLILTGEGEYDGNLNDDITPYIKAVLTNGPTDGRDRSGWLWWLCGKCLEESLSAECALAVLTTADETWTRKYVTRRDGESRLVQIVEKIYA